METFVIMVFMMINGGDDLRDNAVVKKGGKAKKRANLRYDCSMVG